MEKHKIPFKDLDSKTQLKIKKLLQARSYRTDAIGGVFTSLASIGMIPMIIYSAKTNPSEYARSYANLITKNALPLSAVMATLVTATASEAIKANAQVKSQTQESIHQAFQFGLNAVKPEHREALQKYNRAFINRKGDVILTNEREAKTIIGKTIEKLKRKRIQLKE